MKVYNQDDDKELISKFPLDKILDLLFLQIRNIWRVDGLYFQGIEKAYGVEAATNIDIDTWKILAKIEAKDLKRVLGYKVVNNINDIVLLLRLTSWALYQTSKAEIYKNETAIFRIINCRVQEARLKKGLGIFPCKQVRFSYLKSFIEELNPEYTVEVESCPPDNKPVDYWCGWIIKKK